MIKRLNFKTRLPAMLALAGLALLAAPTAARATLMLEVFQQNPAFQLQAGGLPSGVNPRGDVVFVDQQFAVPQPFLQAPPLAAGFVNPLVATGSPDGSDDVDMLGPDANPVAGALSIGGAIPQQIGNFQVTGSAHISNSPGNPDPSVGSLLISSSLSVVNNRDMTTTQTIVVGDTDYVNPPGGPTTLTTLAFGTITNGSVTITYFDDANNVQFGGSINHPSSGPVFSPPPLVFMSPPGSPPVNYNVPQVVGLPGDFVGRPFSKTIQFVLTLNPGGSLVNRSNSMQNTGVIPEIDPGSAASALACLGTGVVMLAGRRRKPTRA